MDRDKAIFQMENGHRESRAQRGIQNEKTWMDRIFGNNTMQYAEFPKERDNDKEARRNSQ